MTLTMGLQRRKRRLLILAHEPAVADDVGRKNRSNPALKAIQGRPAPSELLRAPYAKEGSMGSSSVMAAVSALRLCCFRLAPQVSH